VTRAFVAVHITDAARQAVTAEVERLRALSPPSKPAVAWVPPPNLHLTLQFLGEQPEERLREAESALEEAVAGVPPFEIALHGLGAFPGLERPRILWVGVAGGAVEARGLQARVASALAARGFPPDDRPWHPHLTIGRVFDERRWRRDGRPVLAEQIRRLGSTAFGSVPVGGIALMRSDLHPSGARYSELRGFPLAGR
jgi:RNA 2',3'-cyclic 3'-phosphodiesterase